MEAIRNSLIDEVMHKLTSDEFVNLENRYGKRFANTVRVKEENVRESRLEAFLNLEHWLLPEMLMDNFASAMVLQVLHGIMGIPVEIVAEGVLLSFKYSRLFRHLDILAEELTRLDREAPYLSADERLVLAKEMPRRVWGSDRHNMVIYMQFREGWHRMQLLEHAKRLFGVDIATIAEHLANVSDEYDERIERFITVDLSHWVAREEKKMVRLQRAAEGEPSALLRLIDEKTGWKSLWPNDDRETVMCG
ncbi:MAG: hypothetical protein RBU21_08740 [FCB group bacterium]|nr:hypothetical protein [FCB group bacterium]